MALRYPGLLVLVLLGGCTKEISGYVSDCEDGRPVPGAEVTTNQTGWGWSDQGWLVWDKTYRTATRTDERGFFRLGYRVGDAAKVHVRKDGYHGAEQFEYPGDDLRIGLLRGADPLAYTRHCQLLSACIRCTEREGVMECMDTCSP